MKNLSKSNIFLFVILYFSFSLAFMLYWNSRITEYENTSNQWLFTTIFFLELFCMYVYLSNFKVKVHGIHIVCLLWIVLMPIIMLINHASRIHFFQTILWPLLFETAYFLCLRNRTNIRNLQNIFIPIALIGLVLFLQSRIGMEKQSNTIYFILLTLPWLLYDQKTQRVILLLFVFVLLSFLSLKRSAMLSIIIICVFYIISVLRSRRNRLFFVVISLFLLWGINEIYDVLDEKTGGKVTERVERDETDNSRGRLVIYQLTWDMLKNSSLEQIIYGHGHFAVKQDSFLEMSAHNDFLEVIYDYGALIFVLYLSLWLYVIRRCYLLFRNKSPMFYPYAVSFSLFLILSNISHLILYTSYFNHLVLLWGCTEAYCESHNYFKSKFKQKKLEYKNENRYTYIP